MTNDRRASVTILRTVEELGEISDEWESLLELTPLASGFQAFGWVKAYCETLLEEQDEIFVVVVRLESVPMAIFPHQICSRGRLTFLAQGISNYCGPLYRPERLEESVRTWIDAIRARPKIVSIDLDGIREGSPFLSVARALRIGTLRPPLVVRVNDCPEIDLTPGWQSLLGQHKSKQRSGWKRKERRLASLGDYQFVEVDDSDAVCSALPGLFRLYQERWAGQRIFAAFGKELEDYHVRTAAYNAHGRYIRLSMLTLDSEVIAFSYGIRARGVTSSYVLAHDSVFGRYSVGLLLLLRILEVAAERRDPAYDFSLGETEYKALWASHERGVFRLLWGRGRWRRFAMLNAWVRARSLSWLRTLKVEGLGAVVRKGRAEKPLPDEPGVPAGRGGQWYIYRVNPGGASAGLEFSRWSYRDMRDQLSPRLLQLAIERNFRGDDLLVVRGSGETPRGLIWSASGGRRDLVSGGASDVQLDDTVYYHPLAIGGRLEELVTHLPAEGPCVVVTSTALEPIAGISPLGEFSAGFDFAKAAGSA